MGVSILLHLVNSQIMSFSIINILKFKDVVFTKNHVLTIRIKWNPIPIILFRFKVTTPKLINISTIRFSVSIHTQNITFVFSMKLDIA